MHNLIALGAFLGICVLLFLLKRVLGLFWSASAFYVAMMAYVMYGFDPIVPQSVVVLYGVTSMIALLLYVSASDDSKEEFFGPIMRVLAGGGAMWPLTIIVVLAIPALAAWQSYGASLPSMTPPPKIRSVHPPPPNSIAVRGYGEDQERSLDIIKDDNPYRHLETDDPEKWDEFVKLGKKVYYQNCYYCHGDKLAADGHYAEALRPTPANFLDPGNLPMLQETFVYWRIAKGGPGMPDAGTPWDSSMPVWEKFLNWEEMWAVIAFMYEFTGYQPRAAENMEAH